MSHERNKPAPARRIDLLRRRVSTERASHAADVPHLVRYVTDGRAVPAPPEVTVTEALEFADSAPDRMTMLFYPTPSEDSVKDLARAWKLHPILEEDLIHAHQRPKVERYGETLFLVVRSARYIDDIEEVEFAEFHVLVRPSAVAVLCQDKRWIDGTDGTEFDGEWAKIPDHSAQTLLNDEPLLKLGPEAVLYRILDAIVDGYAPVLQGLAIDREQIERQVFSGDAAVAERIYRLSQEVIDMQHAISSLSEVLDRLTAGLDKHNIPEELQTYLKNVSDHLTRLQTQVSEHREALAQILNVNSTLVAQRQNEDMKKISGWAAILFAPTLIGAIYGMNFDDMPELHWAWGYPMALVMMIALGVALYVIFKQRKWM